MGAEQAVPLIRTLVLLIAQNGLNGTAYGYEAYTKITENCMQWHLIFAENQKTTETT